MIKEGKIVPAEVTVKLLQKAMEKSDNDKFLIDGFPRNDDNRKCFQDVVCISSFMQLCFIVCMYYIHTYICRNYKETFKTARIICFLEKCLLILRIAY